MLDTLDYFLAVELFFIMLHFIIPTYYLYLARMRNQIHVNLQLLTCFAVAGSYPMATTRFCLILSELGYWDIPLGTGLFYFCVGVRAWYLLTLLFTQIAAFVERFIASISLETYEHCKRPWIVLLFLLLINISSSTIAILMNYNIVTLSQMLKFLIGAELCVCLIAVKIYLVNSRAEKDFYNRKVEYSLSCRYQIKENFRVMKLTINVTLMTIVLFSIAGLTTYLYIANSTSALNGIATKLYNVVMTGMPLFEWATIILSFREWRSHLFGVCGLKKYAIRPSCINKTDTQLHFQLLFNSWS